MINNKNLTSNSFDFSQTSLDGHHILEASAGTGKTWNICALIVRLLLEKDINIKQILIVTFTEAACNELKERIRKRIEETIFYFETNGQYELENDPFKEYLEQLNQSEKKDEYLKKLNVVYHEFDEAAIFTIHGFCLRALTLSAFSASQPFSWNLLQSTTDFITEAINDYWRIFIATNQISIYASQLVNIKYLTQLFKSYTERPLIQLSPNLTLPLGLSEIKKLEEEVKSLFNCAKKEFNQNFDTIWELIHSPNLNGNKYRSNSAEDVFNLAKKIFSSNVNELLLTDISETNQNIDSKNGLKLLTTNKINSCIKKGKSSIHHPFFYYINDLFNKSLELQTFLKIFLKTHFLHHTTDIIHQKKK